MISYRPKVTFSCLLLISGFVYLTFLYYSHGRPGDLWDPGSSSIASLQTQITRLSRTEFLDYFSPIFARFRKFRASGIGDIEQFVLDVPEVFDPYANDWQKPVALPDQRLFFCWIPKTACTLFKALFCRTIQSNNTNLVEKLKVLSEPYVHHQCKKHFDEAYAQSILEAADDYFNLTDDHVVTGENVIWRNRSWKKWAVIRDPLDRILSAWNHKCIRGRFTERISRCYNCGRSLACFARRNLKFMTKLSTSGVDTANNPRILQLRERMNMQRRALRYPANPPNGNGVPVFAKPGSKQLGATFNYQNNATNFNSQNDAKNNFKNSIWWDGKELEPLSDDEIDTVLTTPTTYISKDHFFPQYWSCNFKDHLSNYKLFNFGEPHFDLKIKREFQKIGIPNRFLDSGWGETGDRPFMGIKSRISATQSDADRNRHFVATHPEVADMLFKAYAVDYVKFNLGLPEWVSDICERVRSPDQYIMCQWNAYKQLERASIRSQDNGF